MASTVGPAHRYCCSCRTQHETAATSRGHNMACQPGSSIFAAFRFFFPTNFRFFFALFFGGSWLMQIRYFSDPIAGLNKCWMVLLKNLYLPVTQCFEKNNIINTQQISNIVLATYSSSPHFSGLWFRLRHRMMKMRPNLSARPFASLPARTENYQLVLRMLGTTGCEIHWCISA